MTEKLKIQVLAGKQITPDEARSLLLEPDKEKLYSAAGEITRHFRNSLFNLCSIINAKSGRCPENCKWCAQSVHYKTEIEEHGMISSEECTRWAIHNQSQGVRRYALVTSGRKLTTAQLEKALQIYREIRKKSQIKLCASMGLLNREELSRLQEAGVTRYHCNLETAPSFFHELCSTHTQEEKIETIKAAQSLGMDVCSGGIIGMGESMEQRIELAFTLRSLKIRSIPINLLQPIKGTPLENTPLLEEEEILTTIALFRFINPDAWLRFSGGRARLNRETREKALKTGINSAIVGDMLTTVGTRIKDDIELISASGYSI